MKNQEYQNKGSAFLLNRLFKSFLFSLFFLFVLLPSVYSQEHSLSLVISSDKQVYIQGEDVIINYELSNLSGNDITIAPPFDSGGVVNPASFGAAFIIKRQGPGGPVRVFPFASFPSVNIPPDKALSLKKGASHAEKVSIVKINKDSWLKNAVYSSAVYLLQPGKYEISGEYSWSRSRRNLPVSDCWEGKVTSGTIIIEVQAKKQIDQGNMGQYK